MLATFALTRPQQIREPAGYRSNLDSHEADQRAADEQFIAWVLGSGYAAGHLPTGYSDASVDSISETISATVGDSSRPSTAAFRRLRERVSRARSKVEAMVAMAYLGLLGDRN